MGWYPVRQRDNTVLIEDLYFNQPATMERVRTYGDKFIKIKRGGTGRGTRKHPIPVENKGPRHPHYTKLLVEHAMSIGFLNGQRVAAMSRRGT